MCLCDIILHQHFVIFRNAEKSIWLPLSKYPGEPGFLFYSAAALSTLEAKIPHPPKILNKLVETTVV